MLGRNNVSVSEKSSEFGGYTVQEPYTSFFFEQQSPLALTTAARLNGYKSSKAAAPFRYCELGCGHGLTTNILAAAHPESTFLGIDFIKEHIDVARSTSREANLKNVIFEDYDFETVCKLDIEPFDFVTAHGILSWVNSDTKQQLIQAIGRLLKPGGLAYLSYNCLPGWAAISPLTMLMQTTANETDGDTSEKLGKSLDHLVRLRDGGAYYFEDSSQAREQLDSMLSQDRVYLAHEYLIEAQGAQYVKDVLEHMRSEKLDYIGSTYVHRNFDNYSLPSGFSDLIAESNSRIIAEHHRSFLRNEQFRQDVFVQNETDLRPRPDKFEDLIIAATVPVDRIPSEIKFGKMSLGTPNELLTAIVPFVAEGSMSIGELIEHPEFKGVVSPDIVVRAILDLLVTKYFTPLAKKSVSCDFSGQGWRLYSQMSSLAMHKKLFENGDVPLVSPIIGGALTIPPRQTLCLWALLNNTREEAVYAISEVLSNSGKNFVSHPVTKSWIVELIEDFNENWLPLLLRLSVVTPK